MEPNSTVNDSLTQIVYPTIIDKDPLLMKDELALLIYQVGNNTLSKSLDFKECIKWRSLGDFAENERGVHQNGNTILHVAVDVLKKQVKEEGQLGTFFNEVIVHLVRIAFANYKKGGMECLYSQNQEGKYFWQIPESNEDQNFYKDLVIEGQKQIQQINQQDAVTNQATPMEVDSLPSHESSEIVFLSMEEMRHILKDLGDDIFVYLLGPLNETKLFKYRLKADSEELSENLLQIVLKDLFQNEEKKNSLINIAIFIYFIKLIFKNYKDGGFDYLNEVFSYFESIPALEKYTLQNWIKQAQLNDPNLKVTITMPSEISALQKEIDEIAKTEDPSCLNAPNLVENFNLDLLLFDKTFLSKENLILNLLRWVTNEPQNDHQTILSLAIHTYKKSKEKKSILSLYGTIIFLISLFVHTKKTKQRILQREKDLLEKIHSVSTVEQRTIWSKTELPCVRKLIPFFI